MPSLFDPSVNKQYVYSGSKKLTDSIDGSPLDAGKLVLSPTRTYGPIIKAILKEHHAKINGMVHCSGGAQTKVLHFVEGLRIIKDNLFSPPPLFKLIQSESGTDWKEMYRVFNMGHRMEIYTDEHTASEVIEISQSFNVDARIVGRVEGSESKEVIIRSEFGEYTYH